MKTPKLKTEYIDLRDITIAYCKYGTGPALIFLHGNSETKTIFNKFQLEFGESYTTYAPDSRGHGQSGKNENKYTILQFADDVIEFCRAMKIKECMVVGYSDGGNIALCLAVKAPDIFKRLVAISPNYLASGSKKWFLRLIGGIKRTAQFLSRLGFKTKQTIMLVDLMLEDIGLSDEDLRQIKAELLIAYAPKDMIYEEHFKQTADLVPGCKLVKIPKCNHLTIMRREKLREVIWEFLGKKE